MRKRKIWQLQKCDREYAAAIAEELGVSPVVVSVLLNRGVREKEEIREFLFGSEQPFHEPLLMKDMQKAAERILEAVKSGEQITVYGDYDVDGISASSLLYLYLQGIGAKVNTYIPKRKNEGYGLNHEALAALAAAGTTLLVTVDCGISGVDEVAEAPAGLEIIITDHHTPPEVLPAAYAIVNPHQRDCRYPFKYLSGVGVAFKLCQALHQMQHLTEPLWSGLTELVALGTVADIVPLRGENRALVKLGLAAMENTGIVGLRKLIEHSGCPQQNISAENIGFMLAPRLNAVGRLEHAQSAVELLVTGDEAKADEVAEQLNAENALRQEISRRIFIEAEALLAQQERIETAIVLAKEGWHAGVIGIVASRLVDKYHLPTILISIDGDAAKGSCRSIPALDLYSALNECSELLLQFGGHHQAAGLTLRAARVESFRKRFLGVVKGRLEPADYQPRLKIECLLDRNEEVSLQLVKELALLEPLGCDNPPPLFAFKDAVLHYPKTFGRDNNHLRFYTDYGRYSYHSIMWNGAADMVCLYNNAVVDLAFMPKINVWKEKESVNLQVVDYDQALQVYDYRNCNTSKEAVLRNILQTSKKTVIYVNNTSAVPEAAELPDVQVLAYGEPAEQEAENIIFYDFPQQEVFDADALPVPRGAGKRLLLLYTRSEADKYCVELDKLYPGRSQLVHAYKELACTLRQQAVIDRADLLESAANISEDALKVFEELEFIRDEHGKISFGNLQKNDLQNSPTFRGLQEKGRKAFAGCQRNMNISPEEIIGLWQGKRFDK